MWVRTGREAQHVVDVQHHARGGGARLQQPLGPVVVADPVEDDQACFGDRPRVGGVRFVAVGVGARAGDDAAARSQPQAP